MYILERLIRIKNYYQIFFTSKATMFSYLDSIFNPKKKKTPTLFFLSYPTGMDETGWPTFLFSILQPKALLLLAPTNTQLLQRKQARADTHSRVPITLSSNKFIKDVITSVSVKHTIFTNKTPDSSVSYEYIYYIF